MANSAKRRISERGFTLVEFILVTVAVAVMLAVLIPYFQSREQAKWQALADSEPNEIFEVNCDLIEGSGSQENPHTILVRITSRAPYSVDFEWDFWAMILNSALYSARSVGGGPKAFTIAPNETVEVQLPFPSIVRSASPFKLAFVPKDLGRELPTVLEPQGYPYADLHRTQYLVTEEIKIPENWVGEGRQARGNDGGP